MFNIPPSSLSRSFTEGKGGKRNHLIMKSLNYFAVCGNAGLVNKSANEVLLSGKHLEIADGKRYPPMALIPKRLSSRLPNRLSCSSLKI